MFERIKNWLNPPCQHIMNKNVLTWLNKNGTPMVRTQCLDCGWFDEGHVHADPEDYDCRLVIIRLGRVMDWNV